MGAMNEAFPTPYPELNTVLQELKTSVQAVLRDNFVGIYLQGSFAVGDFDLNSDCDFIVVTEDELADDQVEALQALHERIYSLDAEWAKHLEGSYFPKGIVRSPAHSGGPLWYLDHGSRAIIRDNHCNTALVRWIVREKGVTLAGPDPKTLIDPIPVALLRREMLDVIRDWGAEILARPDRYNNRFYQAFIVQNYCRMLHDLLNGFPGSKRAGTEWAKATLDPSWRGLIDRTWPGRINPAVSARTPADPADFAAMVQFVRAIIDEANRRYPEIR